MKERKERYFARLVIFAIAALLVVSFVAIMAYTADKEKSELTTSFKMDIVPARTPAAPSIKLTDPVIWDNGGTVPGGNVLSSQNDAAYPFVSQVADDFMFATALQVTDVHWWGGFWNGPPDEVEPLDFYIYIYGDDGTGTAPTGSDPDPAPTALATYHFTAVSGLPLDINGFYEYDVDLSPPFCATGGVKYWIAIQADFAYPPQWGWAEANALQLHQAVQGFPLVGVSFWTDIVPAVDMAFYLTGRPGCDEWPNHKMHFPQLPDEIGWDVNATNPKVLADDWQCSETGDVTDIHFWGSWKDVDGDPWTDDAGHILYFIFSIHSNIPADTDTPWSRPGELLWERIDSTAITPIDPPTLEGWYDPNTDLTFYNDHVPYWRYDYVDIPDPFFQYQDSIYWLNISAVLEDTFYHWGWKNSRDHFMDDAVYRDEYPGTPPTPWIEMYEPPRANWFDVYFNSTGEPEDMGSTNHYGDGWYFYPLYNWWNMWFYDNPFVYNPKHIWLEFNVDPVGTDPYVELAINWSTDLWSLEGVPDRPPLPGENEDLYIGRQQFEVVPGPNTIDFWINDYNPEWVSIDFRARDVVINGWIWHECVRTSMDLAFVITGGDVPPPEEDFGDCPDAPYPTQLASNGARHTIVPNVFLGATIDPEPNGQQSPDALGDDNDGNDDEDGVVFTTLAVAGNPATVKVTAPVAGFLDAWVDFNFDGDWADAGENIFTSVAVAPGVNFLTFTVPAVATAGITYSRFRFSTAGGLTYTGPAPDGEVEDYRVFILEPIQDDKMHWPQLPDLDNTGMDVDMYEFPLADDFFCIETGLILDAHIWGSFADDILPAGGPGALTFQVEIWSDVTAADNPYGPWSMPWELLCAYTFVPGEYDAYQVGDNNPEDWFDPVTGIWLNDNHLNVYQYDFYFDEATACTQDSGTIYWLAIKDIPPPTDYTFGWKTTEYDLRWNDDATYFFGPLGFWLPMVYPFGHEYQDSTFDLAFVITGRPDQPELDFGDAPDPTYPTLLATNGARHTIVPNVFLGASIDPEADGQQSPDALGDDNDGNDDEDGVVFTSLAVAGNVLTLKVTASVDGFLDGWVDFNFDGDWADAGEQVSVSTALVAGVNSLAFPVPAVTPAGITYSRFRFSTAGGLTDTGPAPDGEVEDYRVFILQPIKDVKMHWKQLPDLDNTGMDVDMFNTVLGDDWMCTETGSVTDIHFWASFAHDSLPAAGVNSLPFGITIHANVPGPPHSMPGANLWSRVFPPGSYVVNQVADNNPEDWYDPVTGMWLDDNHLNAYQYDFFIEDSFFVQDSGTIYWLVVQDLSPPTDYTIGWKTTEIGLRFMDDACYWAPAGGWMPMFYPPGHEYYLPPPQEETLDLAFVITGKPTVKCGDVNNNGVVDVGDVVYVVAYLYRAGPAPIPRVCVGDVNNNDVVDVGDLVYLVRYLYKGGPAPDPNCCNPPWGK